VPFERRWEIINHEACTPGVLAAACRHCAVPPASRMTAARSYTHATDHGHCAVRRWSSFTTRIIAEPMRATLRQPIIIENVAGAAGSVGVTRLASSSVSTLACRASSLFSRE
jgi:Tripartite tricarboxylate transporter family receptor